MRVAALYGIHANPPALEAVMAVPDVVAADLVLVAADEATREFEARAAAGK